MYKPWRFLPQELIKPTETYPMPPAGSQLNAINQWLHQDLVLPARIDPSGDHCCQRNDEPRPNIRWYTDRLILWVILWHWLALQESQNLLRYHYLRIMGRTSLGELHLPQPVTNTLREFLLFISLPKSHNFLIVVAWEANLFLSCAGNRVSVHIPRSMWHERAVRCYHLCKFTPSHLPTHYRNKMHSP